MIDNWFTNKCMTLVGANGRALAGEALELAELALQEVKAANHKVWTDRNGNFYHKERSLFASARPVIDQNGNQVRICGRLVKFKAKFCSTPKTGSQPLLQVWIPSLWVLSWQIASSPTVEWMLLLPSVMLLGTAVSARTSPRARSHWKTCMNTPLNWVWSRQ